MFFKTYTFESLCEFIKVITAPESRSQLMILETEYAEDIYANKELMTIVNKFCERRGYALMFSSTNKNLTIHAKKLFTLPESLITGKT